MLALLGTTASALAAIAWDPEIRNILGVVVGFGVLFGSIYLLVGSNIGLRSGFLVSLTGLMGWMTVMGVIWWIYGIGMLGAGPTWHIEEINYSPDNYSGLEDSNLSEAHILMELKDLPSAQDLLEADPTILPEVLPPEVFEPGQEEILEARTSTVSIGQILEVRPELAEQYTEALDGWDLLPVSDRQRGDAAASADAYLGPDGAGVFEASSDYLVRDVFSAGGKEGHDSDDGPLERAFIKLKSIVNFRHPVHYAVVQIQAVEPVEVVPGEAPPPPVFDEDAPIISIVEVRDLGDKRFPSAMVTLGSGALFVMLSLMLHFRDRRIEEVLAA